MFIIRPGDATVFISRQYFCARRKFRMVFISVAQGGGQICAAIKRNKTAGAPKTNIPNATYLGCIQDIHKRIGLFATKTNCKNLCHISIKITRLTLNSNDFPASGICVPTLYDNEHTDWRQWHYSDF